MRRLLLILSLPLVATCYPHHQARAQPYGSPAPAYAPAPPPGYAPSPAPYARGPLPRSAASANSPENCGTPDEPKPCPPMPRVPLKYYPANR